VKNGRGDIGSKDKHLAAACITCLES
jgi:hypothetical protein